MIDFLTDQPSQKEATATDFTLGPWRIRDDERKALKKLSGEFSQRVAHLAWRRSQLDADQQKVMTEEIFDAIRLQLFAFIEFVDPDRVCPGFIDEAAEAMFSNAAAMQTHRAASAPAHPAALRATTYTGGTAIGALRPETPE